jgi:hypothetical protein
VGAEAAGEVLAGVREREGVQWGARRTESRRESARERKRPCGRVCRRNQVERARSLLSVFVKKIIQKFLQK